MKKFHVITYPNDILRQVAKPITNFDDQLVQLSKDMIKIMHHNKGIGLAGPQIGVLERIFVMVHDNKEYVLINPEVVSSSGDEEQEEGCLSLPDIRIYVNRPTKIRLKYQTLKGKEKIMRAEGMKARIILHELDHLDGKLIIDYGEPVF